MPSIELQDSWTELAHDGLAVSSGTTTQRISRRLSKRMGRRPPLSSSSQSREKPGAFLLVSWTFNVSG